MNIQPSTFAEVWKHITWVPTLFLCIQALIVYAGSEVAFRYARWYLSTAKREGLLLRSLVLGIAVTMTAVVADRFTWMYENLSNAGAIDRLLRLLHAEYERLLFVRAWLYIGIIIHLFPIWRVVYGSSWASIAWKITYRSFLAIAIYFLVLYWRGSLQCLITDNLCPLG